MLKLLLVEDERFTREGLYYDLDWKKIGIDQVKLADNGYSALEVMKTFFPNILLTDVKMPKMNGIDLAYRVKEMNPNCSIIFISGYSDKEYLMSAIKLNALNYVEKPIDLDELTKCLEKAVLEQHDLLEKGIYAENSIAIRLCNNELDQRLTVDLQSIVPNFNNLRTIITMVATNPHQDILFNNQKFIELYSILKESLRNLELLHVLGIHNREIIIHIFLQNLSQCDPIEKLGFSIYDCLKRTLSTTDDIYLGIGKPVNNLSEIYQSYNTAADSLKNSFFLPDQHIHIYKQSKDTNQTSNCPDIDYFMETMISKFTHYLEEGDQCNCISTVKTIKELLCNNPQIGINIAFNVFFNLFVELEKAKASSLFSKQKDILNSNIWNEISNAKSISQLENLLISHIKKFFMDMYETNSNPIIKNIKAIVNKRYHDPGLSLKDISKTLYMCPSYICVLFKRETSKTLTQYINEVRIEKSLELLKNKQYSINDVAIKVGFENGNYYSKIFKKFKGITPTEYRRRFWGE